MSLIHWWPLNGDTKDYIGEKHGTLVNGGNVSAVGKIGKCYSSTNNASNVASSSDGISVPNCNLVGEVGNEYSFACWFKVHGTHGQYQSCIMSSGDWNQGNCWVIGFNNANTEICCPVDNFNTGKISIGYQLNNNVWYHLATVYKDGVTTAYLNGEVVGTVARQGIYRSYSSNSFIGRDEGHGGFFPFNGDINDLRIYDHALSQAEVKELSKALVVHYTFNDTLGEPTTNVNTVSGWSTYSAYWTISERTVTGLKLYRPTGSTSDCVAIQNSSVTSKMAQGDIWTFSCYLYKNGQPYKSTASGISSEGYGYKTVSWESHDDGYYRITFQIISSPGAWVLHNYFFSPIDIGVNCEMRYMQFEKKDHATPYVPYPYARSGLNALVDETGYGHHGTLSIPTHFNLVTDTNLGQYALRNISGEPTARIEINIDPSFINGTGTVCLWYKKDSTAMNYNEGNFLMMTPDRSKESQSWLCATAVNGVPFNGGSASYGTWYYDGIAQSQSNTKDTNWHFYCATGVNLSSWHSLQLHSHGDTSWLYRGNISDLRIYNTVLSADEVLELYNTRALISDKGDILTGAFIEDMTDAQVTDKGVFESDEFEETMYVPSEYELLDYIQSTGTQYIDSGISLGTNMVFDTVVSDVVEGAYIITQGNYGLRYNWGTFVNFVSGRRFRGTIAATAGVVNKVKGSNDFISIDGVNGNQESDNDNPSGNVMISKSGGCKMYKCVLYNGDTLVRYYIPVRRKSDSVLGLYDLVNSKFYTNAGSGTFNAGETLNTIQAKIYNLGNVSGRNIIEI